MPERRRYEKSTCCISGCARWSQMFPGEWLCGRHWKMAGRRLRRALRKVWIELGDLDIANRTRVLSIDEGRRMGRLRELEPRLWAHAKRRVIIKEAGL